MRRKRTDPEEHALHLEALHEMEADVPLLLEERNSLRRWVYAGGDPERNPWKYLDEDCWPLNYVRAYRRHNGYRINIYYHIDEE